MRTVGFCIAVLASWGVCSCADYLTEQEVQDREDDWDGVGAVLDVVAVGIPEGVEEIQYYVVPVLVSDPDCEVEACEYHLRCEDFIGDDVTRSIFDFSHAFVERKNLPVDATHQIDLVIDGLPEGRMLVFLEALGPGGTDPVAHGCGTGQGVLNERSTVRIRLIYLTRYGRS